MGKNKYLNFLYSLLVRRNADRRSFDKRNRAIIKTRKASNNKRIGTKMNVQCFGNVYNEFCFNQTPFDTDWKKSTDKRRKRMGLRFWPPTAQQSFNLQRHYIQGEITGRFRVNGQVFNLVW